MDFQRAYIHEWLSGERILVLFAWLEEWFPWIFGRLGQNPMFIIRKNLVNLSRSPRTR